MYIEFISRCAVSNIYFQDGITQHIIEIREKVGYYTDTDYVPKYYYCSVEFAYRLFHLEE